MIAEEKLGVEEGRQSRAVISGVCRRHQVHHTQFYRWKQLEPGLGRRGPEANYPDEVCQGHRDHKLQTRRILIIV